MHKSRSYFVGSLTIAVVFGAHVALHPYGVDQLAAQFQGSHWYMYFGGPLGVIYVSSSIILPTLLGSQIFFVCVVCGQLAISAVVGE